MTTHDLSDVEKLCQRMMIIDRGQVIYDGTVDDIKSRYGKRRRLIIDLAENYEEINIQNAKIIRQEDHKVCLEFDRDDISASQLIGNVASKYDIIDLTIKEPEIESIIAGIYEDGIRKSDDLLI